METTIEVTGDEGDLTLDYFRNTIRLRRKSDPKIERIEVQPAMPVVGGCAWRGGECRRVSGGGRAGERQTAPDGRMAAQLYLTGLAIEKSNDTGGLGRN